MAKLKEVVSTEVHWQIADWATRDQANIRIRQLMGEDARYFAPVYVTHGGYYWSDPETAGWTLLSDAAEDDKAAAIALLTSLKSKVSARYPGQAARIDNVFTFPNNDFIFIRRLPNGSLDMRITGWGFANYHRAQGSGIIEEMAADDTREVTIAFCIDSRRMPAHEFEFFQGTAWSAQTTNAEGIFSFGRLNPGVTIQVRDTGTGIERIITVTPDTHHVDIDITQYLTVRVSARHDNVPVDGETAVLDYAGHHAEMPLTMGVAECRLPWIPDAECTVALRGQSQSRPLEAETVNLFTFDFVSAPGPVSPPLPEEENFEATVLVTNSAGSPLPNYPITIDYEGTSTSHITDLDGRVEVGTVTSGRTMRVTDGTGLNYSREYELQASQTEYIFELPYVAGEGGDCTLRVIELNGSPAAGVRCVLRQPNGAHIMGLLDSNGEMRFNKSDFELTVPVKVGLYTSRRTFPELTLPLSADENEYELREVAGPTPWWKIAGEILLLVGAFVSLFCVAAIQYGIFESIPLIFA